MKVGNQINGAPPITDSRKLQGCHHKLMYLSFITWTLQHYSRASYNRWIWFDDENEPVLSGTYTAFANSDVLRLTCLRYNQNSLSITSTIDRHLYISKYWFRQLMHRQLLFQRGFFNRPREVRKILNKNLVKIKFLCRWFREFWMIKTIRRRFDISLDLSPHLDVSDRMITVRYIVLSLY